MAWKVACFSRLKAMTAPLDSLPSPPRPGLCVEKGPSVLSSRLCSRAPSASGQDSGAKCNNLCAGARSFAPFPQRQLRAAPRAPPVARRPRPPSSPSRSARTPPAPHSRPTRACSAHAPLALCSHTRDLFFTAFYSPNGTEGWAEREWMDGVGVGWGAGWQVAGCRFT
jgi:hypothetical protein